MSRHPEHPWRALAARQAGVVSRPQLSRLGITKDFVNSQLAAERWQKVSEVVLATTTEAVEVIDGVLEDTAAALESMEATLAGGEQGMEDAAALTASLGTLLTEEVPTALDGVLASMPALVDTARVIDRTMRALSLVGVDYDPEVPLDQSLTGIEQTLEPLPEQLRAQQEALEGLSASMSTMAASLGDQGGRVPMRPLLQQRRAERRSVEVARAHHEHLECLRIHVATFPRLGRDPVRCADRVSREDST